MKYGWHGIPTLRVTLQYESRERQWKDYSATMLWGIGKCIVGDQWTMPEYISLMYPDQSTVDTRTAEDIIDHIRKELE